MAEHEVIVVSSDSSDASPDVSEDEDSDNVPLSSITARAAQGRGQAARGGRGRSARPARAKPKAKQDDGVEKRRTGTRKRRGDMGAKTKDEGSSESKKARTVSTAPENYSTPPPPTINMMTAQAEAPLGGDWLQKGAAHDAAIGLSMQARLGGTYAVSIACTAGVMESLQKQKKVEVQRLARSRPKRIEVIAFDDFGEFSTPPSQIPLSRLLADIRKKRVKLGKGDEQTVLNSLEALQSTLTSPWKRPLIRLLTNTEPGPKEGSYVITFHIYFSRLIFELIADPDIQVVMNALTPAGHVKAEAEVKKQVPQLHRSQASSAADAEFTLPGILHAAENTGYHYTERQPKGLTVTMFEYQLSTYQWMLDHERDPEGLNGYFWQARKWQDGGNDDASSFYYFPLAGELRLFKPSHRTGGLLCEEMGLGKTLEVLALVMGNPRTDLMEVDGVEEEKGKGSRTAGSRGRGKSSRAMEDEDEDEEETDAQVMAMGKRAADAVPKIKTKATLVVLPASLLGQWYSEVPKLCGEGVLDVVVYTGPCTITAPLSCLYDPETLQPLWTPGERELRPQEIRRMKDVCIPWDDPLDPFGAATVDSKGDKAPTSAASSSSASFSAGASASAPEPRNFRKVRVVRSSGTSSVDVAVTYQVSELSRADVVLTTYEAVRSSGAMLKRLDWHRVVLDECQEIRTATTQVARLCSGLHANHRWMVSGTPLASSIDDLHGELAFLDVWPFSLQKDGFWEKKIGEPFKRQDPCSLPLLHKLIEVTMIRHSKGQRYLDNRPLISIPQRTIVWHPVNALSESEMYCYAYIEIHAARECRRLHDVALDMDEDHPINQPRTGAYAKLRALLFFLQRCLTHTSLVPLTQFDTIKRSLQFQERISRSDAGDDIPKLRVDDLLMRLQGLGAARPGGLNRDVGRTWALGGQGAVEERRKYEELSLQVLKDMVAEHGLPTPICWVHLPLRGTVNKREDALKVWVVEPEEAKKDREEGKEPKKIPRINAILAVEDVVRVGGTHDEVAEAVLRALTITDEKGEKANLTLKQKWAAESAQSAPVYKRSVAVRKKAFIDLLLAKEKEEKGITSELHEAGFSSIYKILEGGDVTCPICLTSLNDPTITLCCHAFCKECILAQLEQSESQGHNATRCAVCRKPVKRATLMQLDSEATEEYTTIASEPVRMVGGGASSGGGGGSSSGAASREGQAGSAERLVDLTGDDTNSFSKDDPHGKRPMRRSASGAQGGGGGCGKGKARADGGGKASKKKDETWSSNMPSVGFPPAATEELLASIREVYNPGRDHHLPSLHPSFLAHHQNCHKVISSKVKALLADMEKTLEEDSTSKFVIFTNFSDAINLLAAVFKDRAIQTVQISGQTSKAARQKATTAFAKDPNVKVFLLTTGSGAVGLTLTAANVLYMLEPSHSLSDEAQALNRAHRIGQTRPVRCVIFFVRKTVEERMLAARKRAHAFLDPFDSPEALSVTANSGSQSEKSSTFSIHQLMVLFGLSDSDIGIAPHVHSS